jgi:hypothetical protein
LVCKISASLKTGTATVNRGADDGRDDARGKGKMSQRFAGILLSMCYICMNNDGPAASAFAGMMCTR